MKTNQIIHGNAIGLLPQVDSESVDLVITDPPYLVNYRDRTGRSVANDDNPANVLAVFPELFRVLRPHSYLVLFCGWSAIDKFSAAWTRAGFQIAGHVVWHKPYASNARHLEYRHESAWLLIKGSPKPPMRPLSDMQAWTYSGNRSHPTEKAVEIIVPLIRSFSAPGELVLDPFLGSGTTAVAAALNGRRYIGMELEECYCALARRRIAGVEQFRRIRPLTAPTQTEVAGGLAA